MRFRKSVKICKGVKLNFSKSGMSMTVGGKGASVNVGKDGAFLNTSIPGTGLYDRKRIAGGKKKKKKTAAKTTKKVTSAVTDFSVDYDENGKVTLYDTSNNIIEDSATIRKIKATDEYKDEIAALSDEKMEEYLEQIEEFTKIHEEAIPVYPLDDERNTIGNIHMNEYEVNEYDVEKPSMKEIEDELMEKAQSEVSSVMFWKLDELKKEYVEENKEKVYKEKVKQWEKDKEEFLKKEMENANIANQLYLDEIASNTGLINALKENNEEIVNEEISNWVASIEFPFEFDLQFELDENILRVDLDLPEIEDMLNEKATQMANGEIKIKEKTQKEIKEDYSDCVFGLAIFVTSYLFNIALGATDIILSAYTQRRNSSGKMMDDYILSVHFTRDEFARLNYTKDPRSNCFKFDNICLQTSDNTFKTIKPFE